jgi:signal transduction histidine kinase
MDNLLDISRIESGQLAMVEEEFEVDAFVREIIDTLQTTSTKHTILLIGHAHTTLVGDKDHLGQVFTNLLTNAIKYSPAAQTVDVSVTTSQEQVTISVRDYGIGIPKVHQDRIFERFYRVSDERDKQFPGLGIGLYIASEIIKRHGGTIWVESEEERGSTFSFSLPLKKREEEGITHPFGYCWPHPKGEAENAPHRS